MYVQCERCKTEYEFDDALVSERGTTVKCTTCSHQFKVRRAVTNDGDKWTVTGSTGETFVFTSLKELQRAILSGTVARTDTLQRPGMVSRPLGTIAELEPFFGDPRVPARQAVAGRAAAVSVPPRPGPAQASRSHVDTLRPKALDANSPGAVPPPVHSHDSSPRIAPAPRMTPEPSTAWNEGPGVNGLHPHIPDRLNSERPFPTSGRFAVAAAAPAPTPAVPAADPRSVTQPLVAVTAPVNSPGPYETPSPPLVDGDESSLESSAFPAAGVPRKRRSFAWVAGLVVVGAAGLLAWTYGRSYLVRKGLTITAAPTSVPDTRVVEYLAKADGAFADGDVERAEEGYYKASALAEHDPRVLLGLARAAGYKADVAWLQVRLASELGSGEDETRAVLLGLEDAAAKALRAAENALAVTPAEAPAVRTKIDALRAIGSVDQARKLVSELKSTAPSETAYTLAMLDLAEKEPSGWTAILERLRTAALVEGGSGRARAALVYALAKSGDRTTAAQELERLARQPRVHPALPRLRAYVERPKKSADAGVAGVPAADAGPQSTAAGSSAASQGAPMGGGGTSDPRKLLLAADVARRRGDLGTATQLYEAVLARSPRDSEALGGLGDVAHERRDYPSAKSYYTRALGINSRFLPAKIGMADILWESGDKSAGADAYQDIVDHHPEGAYPAYVKSRAESASK